MLLIRGMLFYILIFLSVYSLSSDDSFLDRKIRCESRFFDQYADRLRLTLRIRKMVLSQLIENTENPIDPDFTDYQYSRQEFLKKCDDFHAKLLANFDQFIAEHKDYAEQDFFRQYNIAKMIDFKKNQKTNNPPSWGLFSVFEKIKKMRELWA